MRRRDFLRSIFAAGAAVPSVHMLGKAGGEVIPDAPPPPLDRLTGLPTGYYELDDLRNGLQPGELVVIAGRPGIGKTSLACNIASHIARIEMRRVLYFALKHGEPPTSIARYMVAADAQVRHDKLCLGKLTPEELQRSRICARDLAAAPLKITGACSVEDITGQIRGAEKVGLVIVDGYGELAGWRGNPAAWRACAVLMDDLRKLSRAAACPTILLAKTSRDADERQDHRPRFYDLPAVAYEMADCVMVLHRDDYYESEGRRKPRETCEAHILKHRLGPTGVVRLTFIKGCGRFENCCGT